MSKESSEQFTSTLFECATFLLLSDDVPPKVKLEILGFIEDLGKRSLAAFRHVAEAFENDIERYCSLIDNMIEISRSHPDPEDVENIEEWNRQVQEWKESISRESPTYSGDLEMLKQDESSIRLAIDLLTKTKLLKTYLRFVKDTKLWFTGWTFRLTNAVAYFWIFLVIYLLWNGTLAGYLPQIFVLSLVSSLAISILRGRMIHRFTKYAASGIYDKYIKKTVRYKKEPNVSEVASCIECPKCHEKRLVVAAGRRGYSARCVKCNKLMRRGTYYRVYLEDFWSVIKRIARAIFW